jgi:tetratricopeptide (TPR) repeat protein
MAEATLAELTLFPDLSVSRKIALVEQAKAQDPRNAGVLIAHSQAVTLVGRMAESVDDADHAAELDPLSPATRTNLINSLLWAGQIDRARAELDRAKELWPGTQTVREAEFALELRSGDFESAIKSETNFGPEFDSYITARSDSTDLKVARFLTEMRRRIPDNFSYFSMAAQGLGEMNRVDDFYRLAAEFAGNPKFAANSYILFRPWMKDIRRDVRFMALAKRLGLVDYWRSSGKWPDFCSEPDLPYDCKTEASKYA